MFNDTEKKIKKGEGYILLSAVAKEKKYAQEYLGLLARRGDIGSIRIGKRWYTKTEWFSEFLADAETRKAETKNFVFPVMPVAEKIERKEESAAKEMVFPMNVMEHQIKIVKPLETSQENPQNAIIAETLQVAVPARKEPIKKESESIIPRKEEAKIIMPRIIKPKPVFQKSFVAERKFETVNLKTSLDVRPVFRRVAADIPKIKKSAQEKESQPLPVENSPDIRNWALKKEDPSPNFIPVASQVGFFPKFAFSMSVVLLLVLLIQFGWVYKKELKGAIGIGSGTVAGAQDSKVNLGVVKNSSAGYLGNQEDKVKENISLSRVLIRAAVERSNAEIK
jgi:hypothetical protein